MTSSSARPDPAALAQTLVEGNAYLTLATVGADGVPWAAPVWFAAREVTEFVWASKHGARHSRHITERAAIALVIFDSSAAPGEGSALYVSAEAVLVDDRALGDVLGVYDARSVEQGLGGWNPAQLRPPARHRLYRAVTLEAFVLDDHDDHDDHDDRIRVV